MSERQQIHVTVNSEAEPDTETLAALTQQLRQWLLNTEVEDVRLMRAGDVPEGAKAAGAFDWNTLLVTLGGSGGVLAGLVGALVSWIKRNKGSRATLTLADGTQFTLENTNIEPAQVDRLIEVMRAASKARPAAPPAASSKKAAGPRK
jgi:hypothetical protein